MGEITKLSGQWIGSFQGPSPGFASLSVEQDRPGLAFSCITQSGKLPESRIDYRTEIKGDDFKAISTQIRVFNREEQRLVSAEDWLKKHGEGVSFPATVVIDGTRKGNLIEGRWHGTTDGTFALKNLAEDGAILADHTFSWAEYREYVNGLIRDGVSRIFRGQADSTFRLRSSLHRHGRFDLLRYRAEVKETLAQHVNAVLPSKFNVKDPDDFGALLSLAQHHGFPTPLLDWTRSPYIAAFFAMEETLRIERRVECYRIFTLDDEAWRNDTKQRFHLSDPTPSITVCEFPAHNNPRHLPQQSVHTVSNVEDIAAWIRLVEVGTNKRYLTIIDIPARERRFAMADLAYMGVTASSLFPGLDGVCRALRERYFAPVW